MGETFKVSNEDTRTTFLAVSEGFCFVGFEQMLPHYAEKICWYFHGRHFINILNYCRFYSDEFSLLKTEDKFSLSCLWCGIDHISVSWASTVPFWFYGGTQTIKMEKNWGCSSTFDPFRTIHKIWEVFLAHLKWNSIEIFPLIYTMFTL